MRKLIEACKGEGLLISCITNLCYLPEYVNRSKKDKNFYQDKKYLQQIQFETVDEVPEESQDIIKPEAVSKPNKKADFVDKCVHILVRKLNITHWHIEFYKDKNDRWTWMLSSPESSEIDIDEYLL